MGEGVEVGRCVGGELQDPSEGVQDLVRGVQIATLFQAHVVVAADTGQEGQFFAAEALDSASSAWGQAHVFGLDLFASCPEVLT
ncbi:hypothetical protein GCM10022235_03780 [Kribbella ginsengisoli]|uniref:Isochorismatase family protein n=1 Tax=Kribbella ginsengisoli TaxID=363865 RepID=A0ABP6VQ97_9ACTN